MKIDVKYYLGEWDNGSPAQVIEFTVLDKKDFYTDKVFNSKYGLFRHTNPIELDTTDSANSLKVRFDTVDEAKVFEERVMDEIKSMVEENRSRYLQFINDENSYDL